MQNNLEQLLNEVTNSSQKLQELSSKFLRSEQAKEIPKDVTQLIKKSQSMLRTAMMGGNVSVDAVNKIFEKVEQYDTNSK